MSIKTLLLAGVLSLTAASAAFAMEGPPTGVGSGNGHASAAPACGYECPLLAGDGGPSGAGDNNGPTAALSQGGGEFRVAASRPGMSGDF